MDPPGALESLIFSPVFEAAVLAVFAAGLGYSVYQMVRDERGFHRFVRQHGFSLQIHSSMWLARVVERVSAFESRGQWDGLPVTIHRRRRGRHGGMTIVVTADADLVLASAGNVTLGSWTTPSPPSLVPDGFTASGRELRLHLKYVRDPAPYVAAAVQYARALTRQPVDGSGPRSATRT
jgi:hypothetical protein